MTRFFWLFALLGFAVWTLLAWGAYGLVSLVGDLAVRNTGVVTGHGGTIEWLSWAFAVLRGLGLAVVVFVWGIGSLLILAVPAGVSLAFGSLARGGAARGGFMRGGPADWQPTGPRPGYRDVTPRAPQAANDDQRRIEDRH